jgi:hypothetical protein
MRYFALKIDNHGNYLSVADFEKPVGASTLQAINIDNTSNILIAGLFSGTCDFDPGAPVYTLSSSSGSTSAFIYKLDPSGNFAWAKNIDGIYSGYGVFLTQDANSGNSYLSASYNNAIDADPGPAVFSLVSPTITGITGTPIPITANFICNLDASGNFITAAAVPVLNNFSSDPQGNLHTIGRLNNLPMDFDPGPGTAILSSTVISMYIGKYSSPVTGLPVFREQSLALELYPNPCRSKFMLNVQGGANESLWISIYNELGEKLNESDIKCGSMVDITNYPQGVYIITVRNKTGMTAMRKIIRE